MGHHTFQVESDKNTGLIDITGSVLAVLKAENAEDGLCTVFVPHTTAAVTINEAADHSVKHDIITELNRMVPIDDGYTHAEGNSAAHIKASLIGNSVSIPLSGGKLSLGTWQGIFFCEFDGPRRRSVHCVVSS